MSPANHRAPVVSAITYEEHGAGLPVLLLHGLGVSSRYWRPLIGPLSTRFRLFALDTLAAREVAGADLMHEMHRIRAPTLVIWGAYDHLFPVGAGEALARAIPDSRFVVQAGAGHDIMWNQPAAFATLVADFLGEPDDG
jgi:pimeloyl-ACP methyl ester carboxylesterase